MSPRPPQPCPAPAGRPRPDGVRHATRPTVRRGFSFVEILFAIAVLGIGFIMLAALFPVGLQQTKLTMDETNAAANARGAVATLEQVAQATVQYLNLGTPVTPQNSTELLPATYIGEIPTTALLPSGQITLQGQLRSFRDARGFADANPPALTPPTPPAARRNTMTDMDMGTRREAIWNRVNGALRSNASDRDGYALLYKRDVIAQNVGGVISHRPATVAQVIVVNAQVAAQSAYSSVDTSVPPLATPPAIFNLEPRPVGVTIQYNPGAGIFTATFASAAGTRPAPFTTNDFGTSGVYAAAAATATGAVAEGAFLVISDDRITAPRLDIGRMNGRIYRIGIVRPDLGTGVWELAPGYQFAVDPGSSGQTNDAASDDIVSLGVAGTGTNGPLYVGGPTYASSNVVTAGPAVAYVLGRGFDNPAVTPGSGSSNYAGPAMDVALYTSFIAVP